FVEFADAFATGSSIMPQKKNPDVAELIRGKSGRLYGNLVAVLTTMKGLPLAYNADMQEDKEPFFDSVDTLEAILGVLPPLLAALTFRTDRMRRAAGEHFSTATDLADYLVKKGVPFRQAHEVDGRPRPRRASRGPSATSPSSSASRPSSSPGPTPYGVSTRPPCATSRWRASSAWTTPGVESRRPRCRSTVGSPATWRSRPSPSTRRRRRAWRAPASPASP